VQVRGRLKNGLCSVSSAERDSAILRDIMIVHGKDPSKCQSLAGESVPDRVQAGRVVRLLELFRVPRVAIVFFMTDGRLLTARGDPLRFSSTLWPRSLTAARQARPDWW